MSTHTASETLLTLENRAGAETLLDRARLHYTQRPDAAALIFIPAGGEPTRHIAYRAFFDGAGCYAEALRNEGVAPRDLVILVMEHGEALLYAFWGAMMMGAIPSIFPFLSDKLDPAMYYERVRLLITHSGARAVIASEQFVEPLRAALAGGSTPVISEADLEPAGAAPTFAAGV
ncbi:MAG: AMP-binding protein, partial [Anaerolineae bacterium]|nr:AMP-binding protein [Anaerolineae bacterium]